ncbi:MAG: hypothetical protein EKK46_05715 [Rhodocyclaceae bacterium]|nr:MAG: hypothetical protein EKK46_05715 [Rhodocyclaceae bacterium]
MSSSLTVKKTITRSTGFGLLLLGILLAVVWIGFSSSINESRYEHQVSQKAILAMLQTRFNVVQIQQFLTDVSATGEADGFKDAEENLKQAQQNLAELGRLQPDLQAKVTAITGQLSQFHEVGVRMAKSYASDGREAGNAIMKAPNEGFDVRAEALTNQLQQLETEIRERSQATADRTERSIETARLISLGLGIGTALLMLFSGRLLYASLIKLLGDEPAEVARLTRRVADGDMVLPRTAESIPAASLLYSLQEMTGRLRLTLMDILAHAAHVQDSANTIARGMDRITEGSSQQNDAARAITSATEELASSVDAINSHAAGIHDEMTETEKVCGEGEALMKRATADIQQIASGVEHAATGIRSLESETEAISAMVNMIHDIADQTNLLALNAAIEAARAGEQGRGFAVVADEVRKLAENTSSTTANITGKIQHIRDLTRISADDMGRSVEQVSSGVAEIEAAASAFTRTRELAQHTTMRFRDISSALQEQQSAAHEIATQVERIAAMSDENMTAIEQGHESTRSLQSQTDFLRSSLAAFRV